MKLLKDAFNRMSSVIAEQFDDQDKVLFAEVKLGQEVKHRLGPVLSEYIETQAQETRFRALGQLEKVSPTKSAEIASLQVEAKSAAMALTWLVNAVERGDIAEEQLRTRDEEETNA